MPWGSSVRFQHSGIDTRKDRWRLILWVLVVLLCVIAFWARSRASLLIIVFTAIGLLLGVGLRKQALLIIAGSLLVLFVAALFPDLIDYIESAVVRKGISEDQGVFHSRWQVWEESLALGIKGGWIGGGYGVTIGAPWFGESSFTAIGYGREKANSQFAIMEELGIVGLVAYAVFLFSLFGLILTSFRRARDTKLRVNLGIVSGALAGFVLNSAFEAWWVAPGSAEAPFFWGLVGVGVGLSQIEAAVARQSATVQGTVPRHTRYSRFPHRAAKT